MTKLAKVFAIVVLLTVPTPQLTAQWAPLATDPNAQNRIQWWKDARVGLFVHWGVYSIPGRGEWIQWVEQIPTREYAKLMAQFHPEHFSADKWTETAEDAGMKYVYVMWNLRVKAILESFELRDSG